VWLGGVPIAAFVRVAAGDCRHRRRMRWHLVSGRGDVGEYAKRFQEQSDKLKGARTCRSFITNDEAITLRPQSLILGRSDQSHTTSSGLQTPPVLVVLYNALPGPFPSKKALSRV